MREIKFRGKRYDSEKWIYGNLVDDDVILTRGCLCVDDDYIGFEDDWSSVKPETVGQFTGLLDKNGTEIYEGDIVTACWYDYEEPSHDTTGIVEFTQGWMAYWIADYENKEFSEINGCGYYSWTIEVIGNIYENPELLGVEE